MVKTRGLALVLALAAVADARAADAPYVLGTGDRLRIAVHERPDLSGEFAIGPSATISLPLVGRIPVEGLTLPGFESALVERLTRSAGLKEPRLTVEIVQYRPFFILGAVENAGQYPFVSGMTVLHAISIAGGFRKADAQDVLVRLEAARARERLKLIGETQAVAMARRARLIAERDDAKEIAFPSALAEFAGPAKAAELVGHERTLKEHRTQSFQAELAVLESQKAIIADEIRALEGLLASKIRQAELNQQELGEIEKLRQRDLVPITRTLALRRSAAELEGDRRQLTSFIARARQETVKVDLSVLNLRKVRNIQIAESLKQTEDESSQLTISRRSAAEQIAHAETAESRTIARASVHDANGEITIVRRGPDGAQEIRAGDDTPVLPGDLVKVPSRPPPANSETPPAARAP